MKRLTLLLLVLALVLSFEKCTPPMENTPPVINSISADLDSVFPLDTITLSFDYFDAGDDSINILWTSQSGNFVPDSHSRTVRWIAAQKPGDYQIQLRISDKTDSMADVDSIRIVVIDRPGTFTDLRDGHSYKWVKIGQQIWMAENLAYLPWDSSVLGDSSGYYVLGFDLHSSDPPKQTLNYQQYGVLYGHESAKRACPKGWHLPTHQEWKTLEVFLGMDPAEADMYDRGDVKSKEVALSLMSDILWRGNNSSGFNAVPGGTIHRYYSMAGHDWHWEYSSGGQSFYLSPFLSPSYKEDLCRTIYGYDYNGRSVVGIDIKLIDELEGFSVRCLKDN